MNIFYLDNDPENAARYQCDKHVVKMILETAQLLCTAHRLLDGVEVLGNEPLYKATHQNHPSSIWVRESSGNYEWLYKHFAFLLDEYTERYSKIHKTSRLLGVLKNLPENIPNAGMKVPPQCMPDEYRNSDTVEAYRNYYIGEKSYMATWKRNKPKWWKDESICN